jgi:hypothetical protein
MRAVRRAGVLALALVAATLMPAQAASRPGCPIVVDAQGDVTPGLVVAPLGDEGGLDVVVGDVSVGDLRLGTTIWLDRLDGAVPTSGVGNHYYFEFDVDGTTLFTHLYHWAGTTSYGAGWKDEDGERFSFTGASSGGSYDPELAMVRVSFDLRELQEAPVPLIRRGTVLSNLRVLTSRYIPEVDEEADGDVATTRSTFRVGQRSCPPYRVQLRGAR